MLTSTPSGGRTSVYSYDQIEFATVAVVALIALGFHAVVAFFAGSRWLFLVGVVSVIAGGFSPGILIPLPGELGAWLGPYLAWRDALIAGTIVCGFGAYAAYFTVSALWRRRPLTNKGDRAASPGGTKGATKKDSRPLP